MNTQNKLHKKTIIFPIIDNNNSQRGMVERFAKENGVQVDFSYYSTRRKLFKNITNYSLHLSGEKEKIELVENYCIKLQKQK